MLFLISLLAFLLIPGALALATSGPIGWLFALALIAWATSRSMRNLRWSRLHNCEVGGAALELLTGFVTAPSTTQTALTMSTGDSLQVRAVTKPVPVRLMQAWTDQQTAGVLRVKSPKMHDQTQGLRLKSISSECQPLIPWGAWQRLYQTDLLSVDLSGSATGGDIETAALLMYYDDLDGANGQFIGFDELLKRAVNIVAVENTLSLGTAGGWSGAEAINSEYDLLKADTKYALVGYHVDVECAAVAWKGADTGNYRVGGPGNEVFKKLTGDWFARLSKAYGLPLIPVFNANNRAGISIDGAQDENGADPLVNSIFVELSK